MHIKKVREASGLTQEQPAYIIDVMLDGMSEKELLVVQATIEGLPFSRHKKRPAFAGRLPVGMAVGVRLYIGFP